MTLNMVHLEIRTPNIVKWARSTKRTLDDRGYLAHEAMRFAFGEKAPQPFELFENEDNKIKVLGYSDFATEELIEEMALLAEPLLVDVFPVAGIKTKRIPVAWCEGLALGFRVRCCPVSRRSSIDGKIKERDAFLAACESAPGEYVSREEVYYEWLRERFKHSGGASIVDARLKAFRLSQFKRRNDHKKFDNIMRPEATFEGILKVIDPDRFSLLIRNGLGRHKAFGFGAIFLRPKGR